MEDNNCRVTFYGLSRSDVHRLVRAAHDIIGDYWVRRVDVVPADTQWFVEIRHAGASNWTVAYGPWDEANATSFCHMWNAKAGYDLYRARPAMTERSR